MVMEFDTDAVTDPEMAGNEPTVTVPEMTGRLETVTVDAGSEETVTVPEMAGREPMVTVPRMGRGSACDVVLSSLSSVLYQCDAALMAVFPLGPS